jgi:hypothetical protein
MTSTITKRYKGHFPGYLREAFVEAVEAYQLWELGEPEPTVEIYTYDQPVQMLVSEVFRKLWHCTDIMPSLYLGGLIDLDIYPKRQTYAAAARALMEHFRKEKAKAQKFERFETHDHVGYDS